MTRPQAVATTVISYEVHTWDELHGVLDEAMRQFGPTLTGFHWAVPADVHKRFFHLIVNHMSADDRLERRWWNDRWLGLPVVVTNAYGPVELRWIANRVVLEPRRDTYDD